MEVEVVAQFSDGREAVTKALQCMAAYIAGGGASTEALAQEHAPHALAHKHARRRTPGAGIAVFDIDDTLLFDVDAAPTRSENVIPHNVVVSLMTRLVELGTEVHLVTARLNELDVLEATVAELRALGLAGKYHSLTLAPPRARDSLAGVSRWKMQVRRRIAAQRRCPVTLTVGDQWGDQVCLNEDEDIDTLDERFASHTLPYILTRPHDGVSLWGLKLPAYD